MGRTNPTFRNLLEAVKSRWNEYRRALRRQDKPHFDRLFEHADAHADAAGYLNGDDPMNPVLVSMLLEHEKQLDDLEGRVSALESEPVESEPVESRPPRSRSPEPQADNGDTTGQ